MKIFKLIVLLLLTTNFLVAQTTTTYGTSAGATGSQSSHFGYRAGNADAGANTFMGAYAGEKSTGGGNVAVGNVALRENVGGGNNTAMGNNAAKDAVSGSENVSIGASAGKKNTSGSGNVAVGFTAGFHTTGSNNVFLGYQAGSDASLINVSNRLYIENSNDVETPLIYGDFAANQVGIGTSFIPLDPETGNPFTLAINGSAVAEEVQVIARGDWDWPDYVFAEDYKLMSLTDLETEIATLGHLPGVPSAEEVEENGHALGRMDAILLEKIEELTLHLIDINKEVKTLREENNSLKNEVKAFKKGKKKQKK